MNVKQVLALVGACMLIVGTFAPILSMGMFGSVNYFGNGRGDGVFVLVAAIVVVVLAVMNRTKWLWTVGAGTIALLAFAVVRYNIEFERAKAQMRADLEGNMFAGLADVIADSVQIQWGAAVLVMGAVIVIASSVLRLPGRKEEPQIRTSKRAAHPPRISPPPLPEQRSWEPQKLPWE